MKGLAIALGNFDGVHLGHQAILKHLVKTCRKKGWVPCAYTFEPHPAKILSPKSAPKLLQTLEQKRRALKALGVQRVFVEPFTTLFLKKSPETFFNEVLVRKFKVRGIWVGYDFTFGYRRKGTIERLKKMCAAKKIPLFVLSAQFKNKTLISSSSIRGLLQQGGVEMAHKLLGRPFALIGKVVKGHGYGGGKLGIHTANLKAQNELLPKNGIYITRTTLRGTIARSTIARISKHDRTTFWPSATSVGFNPTFPEKGFSVETHLIGYKGNLRGKKIEVEFLKWLRDELTFPNPETLADQIHKDIAEALHFHETLRHHR